MWRSPSSGKSASRGSGLGPSVPALFTIRSRPPRRRAASMRSARWEPTVMSPGIATTSVLALNSAATRLRSPAPRASITSRQPASARPRASASPRPREAPVMSATDIRASDGCAALAGCKTAAHDRRSVGPLPCGRRRSSRDRRCGRTVDARKPSSHGHRTAGVGLWAEAPGQTDEYRRGVTDRTGARAGIRARAAARQSDAADGTHCAVKPDAQQAAGELDSLCAGQARAELEAVSSAVLAVTKHLSVRQVLQTIVTAARSLSQAEYAALGVPDSIGSFAEFVVDGISDEQWAAIGPLPRQHGLLGIMLQEARPQRLPDITKDPRFVGDWPPAHPALKDFLGMPVMDGEDILGAIYLANKRGGAGFTDADERMLSVLAAHAAIALTNARLYEQSRELTIVQERQRIARELHDAVAQKLFSLRLTADAAATLGELDPARAAAELATVRRLAAEAADELRQVVIELRPADLAGDGLPAVLRKQVDVLNRVGGTTVTLVVDGWRRLPIEREEAVLRVAQEALHNAMRHAEASSITVR